MGKAVLESADETPSVSCRLEGGGEVAVTEVISQLGRLLDSQYFRHSRRYPKLLRFIVEQTLDGHPEVLKERTLGVAVFGRPGDYDSNADPVVRITAGEVRKRLAQYYQEPGHAGELRVELVLGSYVAHFAAPPAPFVVENAPVPELTPDPMPLSSTPEPHLIPALPVTVESLVAPIAPLSPPLVPTTGRHPIWLRWAVLIFGVLALAVLAAWLGYRVPHPLALPPEAHSSFWQPLIGSREPVEVVLGVHTLDRQGNDLAGTGGKADGDMLAAMLRTDMVPVSDIVATAQMTDLLTASGQPYRVLSAERASLKEVRSAPVLLVGGLNNAWTLRLTAPLRYHFYRQDQSASTIVDRDEPTKSWSFNNLQSVAGASTDYALVASFEDTSIGRPVVVVAGIGMAGTLAGAELVTHGKQLDTALAMAGKHRNVELLVRTDILNDEPGPPRVIGVSSW